MPDSQRAEGAKSYMTERGFGVIDALDAVAKEHNTHVVAVALAWLLAKPAVPDPIIGELKILAKQHRTAKAALKLAMTFEHMPTRSVGDNSVLELARELKGIIMSNDKALIETARVSGIRVIRLRETARLAFDNDWLD